MPGEENIPSGGPGDQSQTQQPTTAQPQTQEEININKLAKVKKELKIKIPENTPQEREVSAKIEDSHNKDVLNQP